MLDGWTEVFAVPGARATGGAAKTFLITGPGWSGTVPERMHELKSPTSLVWLLGRIYCTGTKRDYDSVHALQDAFRLQPLGTSGSAYTAPAGTVDASIYTKTPTRDEVNAMTFAKGQTPPVKGFWSLTMYDENMFFVANPINRYSMSVGTNPKLGEDGSLVLHIQNENPGPDKEANWLPSPTGKFHLMLRLYWPDENLPSIIDGSWAPPAVGKV
jgi:hypothetical protein